MKLLLTSAGFSTSRIKAAFFDLVGKKPADIKLLMIPTGFYGWDDGKEIVDDSIKTLNKLGITSITILELDKHITARDLAGYDTIFVHGGATYTLMHYMRTSGFDKAIIDYLKKGGVFVGISASSICAGPSVDVAGVGVDADHNEIGLKNTSGLGLSKTALFTHYKPKRHQHEVEEFQRKVPYRVLGLTDKQAMLIIDGKETII